MGFRLRGHFCGFSSLHSNTAHSYLVGFDLQAVVAHGCVEFWDLRAYHNWDYGITAVGVRP